MINNVETLTNVPIIMLRGADWFRSFGAQAVRELNFALAGKIKNTGLVEVLWSYLARFDFGIGGGYRTTKVQNGADWRAFRRMFN